MFGDCKTFNQKQEDYVLCHSYMKIFTSPLTKFGRNWIMNSVSRDSGARREYTVTCPRFRDE
jgi:hypothetical protein